MSVKWDDVQTKVVTWGIIALLGLMGTSYYKLVQLEAKVQMIEDNIIAYWENLE